MRIAVKLLVVRITKMIGADEHHDDGGQDDVQEDDDQNYGWWLEMKMVRAT